MSKPIKKSNSTSRPISNQNTARSAQGSAPANLLMPNQFEGGFWKKWWLPALIVFSLSFIVYWQTLPYEYILDDQMVITNNSYTKDSSLMDGISNILSHESFQGYFGEQKDLVTGSRYRPLSIITFAIENHFFGLNPKVGHFGNILLYGLMGLLLLRIFQLIVPSSDDKRWYWSIPFIATVLFMLHPIHSEVVANIKGRDEIMSLLGALAALYLSLRYLKDQKRTWLIGSGIVFFLALMSKENALTFLLVIPVTLWFFTKAGRGTILKTCMPLIAATFVYLLIRYQVIGYLINSGKPSTLLMNDPFLGMNFIQKYSTIFYTLLLYIKLLFFPHPLTHDYYPYQIPKMHLGDWQVLLSLAVHAFLVFVMIKNWRSKKVLSYILAFYFLTLSITSNIFLPVGTFMNERFVFASSVASCLFISYLCINWLPQFLNKNGALGRFLGIALIAVFAVGFTYKSFDRIPAWKDTMSLNRAAIKVSKNSARANSFMSTSLFEEYRVETDPAKQQQLLALAEPYMRRALEIVPDYNDALTMKAGIAAEKYKFHHNLDSLLTEFQEVLFYMPGQNYIKQYLDYLNKNPANAPVLVPFYISTAKMMQTKLAKLDYAMMYLDMGRQVEPNNSQIAALMTDINAKMNPQPAPQGGQQNDDGRTINFQ